MVHNHGPEDGPGLACNEALMPDGSRRGACLLTARARVAARGDATTSKPRPTPEQFARDAIVSYLGSVPVIRMQAQHNASTLGGNVDSAYLVGAALQLGSLSHESLLTLIVRGIEAATAATPADAEAAWANHSIGFTWDSEQHRYGEYRAYLAGFADRTNA